MHPLVLPGLLVALAAALMGAGLWVAARGGLAAYRAVRRPPDSRGLTPWRRSRPLLEGAALLLAGCAAARWGGRLLPS